MWHRGHNMEMWTCGITWRNCTTALRRGHYFGMLRLRPKGVLLSPYQRNRGGREDLHLPLLMVQLQVPPPSLSSSSLWFSSSSYYSCFLPRGHIPTLWPEGILILSVVTSSTFTAEIPAASGGGWGTGGLLSQGTMGQAAFHHCPISLQSST